MAHIPKSGQAGTELGEIEVTPAMIEAGVTVLTFFDRQRDRGSDLVSDVFQAMWRARNLALATTQQR